MPGIKEIKKEYEGILNQLSDPELISNWEKFQELTKRKSHLEKIIGKEKELEELKNRIKENQSIISAKEDSELVSLAEAEISQLLEREKALEKELEVLIKIEPETEDKQKKDYSQSVIVEIRAGTGGKEAALFSADLYRMYSKYASALNWKQKILDSRPTDLDGLKEIIFEMSNGDVFSKMKYEGGVHRVQRIPETEKTERIHTSTASVAVFKKPKKTEAKIRPDELKIDFYRASGPGGQYVNKRETAVRITHLPSGLVVTSQTERNQLANKENAISILEVRLLEKKQSEEEGKIAGKRKTQIGGAKRAEKVRTYNFPQDRVTDHRIKKSWHNMEEILNGKLDQIIKALQKSGHLV